jgi:hypothetical protein
MFTFYNYGIMLAKVSCVILRLFQLILLFMRLISLVVTFVEDIRSVTAYFVVYALFWLFMIVVGT